MGGRKQAWAGEKLDCNAIWVKTSAEPTESPRVEMALQRCPRQVSHARCAVRPGPLFPCPNQLSPKRAAANGCLPTALEHSGE